ncbi:MAG: hypothetical protein KGL43_18935, partial [Burkholderiales bacterium]|nr:hypothetical protein [Burkholderiales bacterium]
MATELNLQMTLTLADAASAPLRAFAEALTQLKATSTGVAKNLEAIAVGITNVGKAAAGATSLDTFTASLAALTAAMTGVKTASAGVATEVGNVGKKASAAGVGTYSLEQAMGALGGTLNGMTARLTEIATDLGQIGTEARAAGRGVRAGTAAMEEGLAATNVQAGTLATSLKGLGQLYAALKIEKGLKASAEQAIDYEATRTRLQALGLSSGDQITMTQAAADASRLRPQFSQGETLAMAIDLRNATGSVEHALNMLGPFATAAFNMRMATPHGKTFSEGDMLLIAKALEQRNATMDLARMNAELEMFTKAYVATQGRVNATQILGNLQYAKGGLGQTMDLSFIPTFVAMIEQIRSAGGNGGQIGTWLTSLQQAVIQGQGNARAQKERASLGLLDPAKLVWNKLGNIDQQKSDLTMAGATEFQANPYKWVQDILKPAL